MKLTFGQQPLSALKATQSQVSQMTQQPVQFAQALDSIQFSGNQKPDAVKMRAVLDEAYYGLDDVKQQIIDFYQSPESATKSLAIVGPSGVVKSYLARVVNQSLGRESGYVNLAGVRDQSYFIGDDPKYINAKSGVFAHELDFSKSDRLGLVLDHLDLAHGDETFMDVMNTVLTDKVVEDVFAGKRDLSDVNMILTFSDETSIPAAIKENVHVVNVPAYTNEEMAAAVKSHLLPQVAKDYALEATMTDDAIDTLVEDYTYAGDIRDMKHMLGLLIDSALFKAEQGSATSSFDFTKEDVDNALVKKS